jgi:chemotaxis protein MotB
MARPRKQPEPESSPGAPLWMVTFSDCMNLLLTFFVVLVTFSAFGKDPHQQMLNIGAAIRMSLGVPAPIGGREDRSAVPVNYRIWAVAEPEYGSEKPTNVARDTARDGTLQQDIETADYRTHKVFLIPSRKVFLGQGAALSPEGRYLLAVMAAFLQEVPGRVVLSENGPEQPENRDLGLSRAWAVAEYLATLRTLDCERFSISAQTTLTLETVSADAAVQGPDGRERMLEVVLLERSVQL